ncbi:MAG: hypothetical protein ACI8PZ_000449 [Myxococcota bacterium]|jgi:hypothetical protein
MIAVVALLACSLDPKTTSADTAVRVDSGASATTPGATTEPPTHTSSVTTPSGTAPDALGDPLGGDGRVDRIHWTAEALRDGLVGSEPVPTEAFALPVAAAPPTHDVSGTWSLATDPRPAWTTWADLAGLESYARYRELPALTFDVSQQGSHVVPHEHGWQRTGHAGYDLILAPGRAWSEQGDAGATRVAVPFALVEHNGNCTHDGLLTWLVDDAGPSRVGWQVVQETCLHHKFDAWGATFAEWTPSPAEPAVTAAWTDEVLNRMPAEPLSDLGLEPDALRAGVDPTDLSALWVLSEGRLYADTPVTRWGVHPFPEVRPLPSFSTAKTLFVGMGAWWLAAEHGDGFRTTPVSELVPGASVLGDALMVEHLLDMSTGRYHSAVHDEDEAGATMAAFFAVEAHREKLAIALTFPRQEPPGSRFVYHTSDSYLAVAALEGWLDRYEPGADLLDRVWEEVWAPLSISTLSRASLRATVEAPDDGQAYGGYGLWWTTDGVARLAAFLAQGAPGLTGADAALQRDPSDPGVPALDGEWRYNDHTWAVRLGPDDGFPCERWVPLMSGYGGIAIVFLPSGDVLGVFGDSDAHDWRPGARALYDRTPWCP